MKRYAIISLLMVMALMLQACDKEGNSAVNTETGMETQTAAEETELTDGLPDTDMQGFTFKMLHHEQSCLNWAEAMLQAEELNGEILNDAIFNREQYLRERFNCAVEVTENPTLIGPEVIKPYVLSGESTYDVVLMYDVQILNDIQYLYDMSQIPHIRFDAEWWNPEASSIYQMDGIRLAAAGNYSLSIVSRASGYMYNRDIVRNLGMETPYEMVKNDTWTIDNMYMLADAACMDLNGDGEMTSEDQFGIISHLKGHFTRSIIGSDVTFVDRDEKGYPVFRLPTDEVAVTKMQHILELSAAGDGWYETDQDAVNTVSPLFADAFRNGTGLFEVGTPFALGSAREYDFDLGIVPIPKYDTEQQSYYAPTSGGEISVMLRSFDAGRAEYVGTLMEAMAFYTHQNIIPEYQDVLVMKKNARDQENAEMLEIMYDNIRFDLCINAWELQCTVPLMEGAFAGLKGNFASTLAGMQNTIDAEIEKLKEEIAEMKQIFN